ncbi:MAG: HD-GYP domain-containing protein [Longimicrobiales bacterium]
MAPARETRKRHSSRGARGARATTTVDDRVTLQAELAAIAWVHQEVRTRRHLPLAEVEGVAGSLFLRLRECQGRHLSLIRFSDNDSFLAVHAINVSLIAMALAEFVQFDEKAVRRIGLAGLLHDIGMARIPQHIVVKPGQFSPDEREAIKLHPQEGARLILEADTSLDLAAIVAYEHHIKLDGSGYPRLRFPRAPHYVSRLVQLCDIYHALRSPRPFRQAWPPEIVASFLNERAGFEYHPALATALTTMMPRLEPLAEA